MSDEARRRAEEVAELPHVKAWARRLRKLFRETPPEVSVFCESGAPYVMARRPEEEARSHKDGHDYLLDRDHGNMSGGMDQDAIAFHVTQGGRYKSGGGNWDGGGW